jgi:cyclohexanone monooxygenase
VLQEATSSPAATGGGDHTDVEVLILGGGLCGMAAAIGLRREGIEDFVIVERSDDLGGTWHHNRYPGCAVDIPSHVYSFSFALQPNWSRIYAPQEELEQYLFDVAREHRLYDHAVLNTEVLDAAWDEDDQRWIVATTNGTYRARVFITAPGPLHEAIEPNLPGLDRFEGLAFHSSVWPSDADLSGRRVVAIGTGASAIQFLPRVQKQAEHLTVLQRTPSWVLPKIDWNVSERHQRTLRRLPFLMRVMRYGMWAPMDVLFLLTTRHPRLAQTMALIARGYMRTVVKDRATRRALTPDYAPTCKRLGFSNEYLQTFNADNVELVTSPAAEIREHSVVTADGREIECDTIIYGTGFRTLPHHPANERVRGRDGRSLAEVWNGRPEAYLGTTIAGFPNAFMYFGPNIGTLSGFVMAEAQTDYIVGALRALRDNDLASIDVRPDVQDAFTTKVHATLKGSTWATGGCVSYYLDDGGRVAMIWPWTMAGMRRRLARFDLAAYRSRARTGDRAAT